MEQWGGWISDISDPISGSNWVEGTEEKGLPQRAERERRLGRQDAEVEVPSKLRASLRRAKGALLRMTGVFLVVHMGRGRWCGTDGKRDSSGLKARATGLE